MRQLKKLLALLLALATVCSTLSVTAWASDVEETDDPDAIVGEDISEEDKNLASPFGGGGAAIGGEVEGDDAQTPDNAPVGSGDPDAPDDDEEPTAPAKASAKAASNIVANGKCGDNLTWTIDDKGVLTISGRGKMCDYGVYWEEAAEDWIDHDNPMAEYRDQITSVVVKSGVTSIGSWAFIGCGNLTSVAIPSSVTTIGDYAFCSCENLTSITIPNSVTNIGGQAFCECRSLTSVTIPASATEIALSAFQDCTSLASVTIQNGVTSIGGAAFCGCTSLTRVEIPKSVTFIGDHAFGDCTSLKNVSILSNGAVPDFYMEKTAFDNTLLVNSQTGDFLIIDRYLCQYRGKGNTVMIPDNVVCIGSRAFEDCDNLTSIKIPGSVAFIGDSAFYSCDGLTSVTIPDGVTEIDKEAFYNCNNLTSVTISGSVKSIGDGAFELCPKLSNVAIASGVEKIGVVAFRGCPKLTKITIPKSVTEIGEIAFGFYFDESFDVNLQVNGFAVSGYTGSAAETYAKENGFSFKALDKPAVTKLLAPALPTVKTASNGIIINWSKVSGAEKYRVYRKTGNGSWQKLGDTTGTGWTDRTAEKGKTYSYTICCVSKDGKTETSDYNKTGKSVLFYVATPAITTLQSASGGVIINWGKVSGAAKYRVFRRVGSGNWERVADVTDTRAVDRTAKKGVTYTYTVRCISSDSKTYTSDFNKTGKSIKYGTAEPMNLKTPAITNLQNASGGIIINWGKVSGATRYRVFRRVGSGNWERVADVTDTRAVDRNAKKGVTYTYTVRCVTSDGKTYASSFNSKGWTIKR